MRRVMCESYFNLGRAEETCLRELLFQTRCAQYFLGEVRLVCIRGPETPRYEYFG